MTWFQRNLVCSLRVRSLVRIFAVAILAIGSTASVGGRLLAADNILVFEGFGRIGGTRHVGASLAGLPPPLERIGGRRRLWRSLPMRADATAL